MLCLGLLPLAYAGNRDWAWPFFSVVICVLALVTLPQSRQLLESSRVLRAAIVAFLLLILWIGMQLLGVYSVTSLDSFSTEKELYKSITLLCVFMITVGLVDSQRRTLILCYVLLLCGLLQAVSGIFMTLLGFEPAARGSFPNPNHFGGYLEMSLSVGLGLMISMQGIDEAPRNVKNRLINLIDIVTGPKGRLRLLLVILVIGLVMSASRMANIAFFTSIVISALILAVRTRRFHVPTAVFLVSVLIIDAAFVGNYFGIDRISERVQNLSLDTEMRDEINAYSLAMISDRPLVGFGAGAYRYAFTQYRGDDVKLHFKYAENDYLQFVVELGLVGSLPLLVLLVMSLALQIRLLGLRYSRFIRGIAFGCLTGTVSMLIHATADFNLRIPANAVYFTVLLALPYGLQALHKKGLNQPRKELP